MKDHQFEVKPVHHYDGADYPSPHQSQPPEQTTEQGLAGSLVVLCLVVVVALSLGLMGCYLKVDIVDDTPQPQVCGGDGDPPPDPSLTNLPGCHDGRYQYCEDGALVSRDCDEYCRENLGPDAYSMGCDAQSPDPCLCEYGIIDGDMAYLCLPEERMCQDDRTVAFCEAGEFIPQSCDEYCRDTLGPMAYSMGCDDQAEDPCQCEYDMVEGEMGAVCFPSSVICVDDDTVNICDDVGESISTVSCQEHCEGELGAGASSPGCDPSAGDDPCQCESGSSQE